MYFAVGVDSRIAPPFFQLGAGRWRGRLSRAVVAATGGVTGGGTGTQTGRDLVTGAPGTAGTNVQRRGEAYGPAIRCASTGEAFATLNGSLAPNAAPLSVFAFLVRRDSSASIQSICGNSTGATGGWTFQLNYGAGQLGLTRWGIADNPATALGTVPNTNGQASAVGMVHNGSTTRFFLNGRFLSIATGGFNAPASNGFSIGANTSNTHACVDCTFYAVYVWARLLNDGELLALMQDPWAPVRPPGLPWSLVGAGAPPGGSGARVFVPAFIG